MIKAIEWSEFKTLDQTIKYDIEKQQTYEYQRKLWREMHPQRDIRK